MKEKNPKSKIYFGNHFCLLFLGIFFSFKAIQAVDKFEGTFSVTIPGDRLLKSMKLGVKSSQNQYMTINQNQSYAQPDSMIQVGNLSRMTLKKSQRGKLRYKGSERSSIQAVFYLFDNVKLLKKFSIEPKFYSKNNEFHSTGQTDKVFALEFMEVTRIGEVHGKSMKKIKSISFQIGQENNFNVDLRPQNGKKIAVKLSTLSTGEYFLHLPVKKSGKYPIELLNRDNNRIRKVYAAPVKFSYIPIKLGSDNSDDGLNFYQLTNEVNNFVKSHPDYGKSTVIDVPISLQMNLVGPDDSEALEAVVGPPQKKSISRDGKSSKKRRRNFLGF